MRNFLGSMSARRSEPTGRIQATFRSRTRYSSSARLQTSRYYWSQFGTFARLCSSANARFFATEEAFGPRPVWAALRHRPEYLHLARTVLAPAVYVLFLDATVP
jgi:hypothetical protein